VGTRTEAEAAEAVRWARKQGYDALAKQRRSISGQYFSKAYGGVIAYARNALEARGATFD
jgi:hypothetical protein